MKDTATGMQAVIKASEQLIDAVSNDVSRHGGLTSRETVRASDELRLAISRFREGPMDLEDLF